MSSLQLTSLSAYLPGSQIDQEFARKLGGYLRKNTRLPNAYIEQIETGAVLPGAPESNEEGWASKPWFNAWLNRLPPKKREQPFQGAEQRLRVPPDPDSLTQSVYPHPMLPSDAETIAGAMALVAAEIDPDSVDLLMAASQVPDRALPANVSLLQYKLGLKHAGAYAVDTCCSSFVTLLELACALVRSGFKKRILVVSSFLDSHVSDRSDYFSVVTGDAACAAIVECKDGPCDFISSASSSHGERHAGIIYQRRSPQLLRSTGTSPSYAQEFTTFNDMEACKSIAENAAADLREVVARALDTAQLNVTAIDLLVTHQPVAWAPEVWRAAIGVAEPCFQHTFQQLGNIANCCAPANLFTAITLGKLREEQRVMLASSGAGENHIAVFMRASKQLIASVQRQGLHFHGMEKL